MPPSSGTRKRKKRTQNTTTPDVDDAAWKELSADIQKQIKEVVANKGSTLHTFVSNLVVPVDLDRLEDRNNAEYYLADCVQRSNRITRVFALLDVDQKGCVVANDIVRAANDLAHRGEPFIDEEQAIEMMEEFGGEDGVLNVQDIASIAEKVGL